MFDFAEEERFVCVLAVCFTCVRVRRGGDVGW